MPPPSNASSIRSSSASIPPRSVIARDQSRVWYSPVRVSIRSVSPSLTNSGTTTTRPVSIVAFLRAPWAVSPANPGSVSVDQEVDGDRELDAERVALVARPVEDHAVLQEVDDVVERLGPQAELLVGLGLHEVEVVAVAIQELDRAAVDLRARPALARLERLLDGAALLDVAQLDPDLGRAAAHLDVVVVEDLPQVAIKLDDDALAQLAGADHGVVLRWAGAWRADSPREVV